MDYYKKISSAQNPLIKKIVQLQTKKSVREQENLIILEGLHLCQTFSESGGAFQEILISETYHEKIKNKTLSKEDQTFWEKIEEKRNQSNQVEKIEIPDFILEKCTQTKTPSGVIAIGKKPKNNLENLKSQDLDFVLMLENISDPGNLGTIIRTAVCSGVQAIFCTPETTDIWSPKVLRSAQGAHFYLPIFPNFPLQSLKKYFSGNILGTTLEPKSESLYAINLKQKTAFLFGNEGQGITQEAKDLCDGWVKIPMENNFESLNVGTAVAVCCFEKKRIDNI